MRLHLHDGRILEHHEPINRGCAERPLAEAEVLAKFWRNAERAIAPEQAQTAIAAVQSLATSRDLTELAAALRPAT